jgi:ABC-type sugar transport system ATPase subunit
VSEAPFVSVRGLQKHFGGIQALKGVDLDILPGEVHGLVGANGAGKSTLIKVLAGVEKPDAGSLSIDGVDVQLSGSQQAADLGLSFIHQELNLVPCWNALENIMLGAPKRTRLGVIDWRAIRAQVQPVADKVGIQFSLSAPVARLSPAEKWLISICRALVRKARLISMDEPTASLSIRESENLFRIVRALAAEGVAVLYVSHRLDEIMDLCHRVTAFRDGRSVMQSERSTLTRKQLLEAIVGGEAPVSEHHPIPYDNSRPPLLRVSQLVSGHSVREVSFDLQKGEVLGLAGLVGSGRTELVRVVFGADQPDSGTMTLEDRAYSPRSPADAVNFGVGFVPEERRAEGLFAGKSVAFNLTIANLLDLRIQPWLPLLDGRRRAGMAKEIGSRLQVKASSMDTLVDHLSGGNQQKIVIGKWLVRNPKLLILDEPSRGVDVGARGEIHRIIRELVAQGMSVIVISSEAEELPGLCDRVLVMAEGKIVQELSGDTITRDAIVHASYHRTASAV